MALRIVTVFGGSGFIGRHFIKRLARTGAVIRVPVRRAEAAKFLKPMGDVGQITPLPVDVTDEAATAAAIAGADAVVNLVGITAEGGRFRFDAVHVEAAQRIARLAAAAGVRRLVHMSGIGVDPQSPSRYVRSKAAGEAAVRTALPAATVLRPSIVFGPEDGFFNRLAAMARIAPVMPVFDGGRARLQPVFVGDVADALMAVLERPDSGGRVFELGGPRIYTMRALVELTLRETGRHRPLVFVPTALAALAAGLAERLPAPPLTRDQLYLLTHDNVVPAGAATLDDLGVLPTAVESIVPTYLDRFRKGGRFAVRHPAG